MIIFWGLIVSPLGREERVNLVDLARGFRANIARDSANAIGPNTNVSPVRAREAGK